MESNGLGRLRGKSAVVTGAAKGIGRATAELFAREGARLVITDVDEEGLAGLRDGLAEEVAGAEVEMVVGDVSVVEDAKAMIGASVERFGRIDVLVANAGVIPLNNIVDATVADWDHVMAVDGRGMFLCCKFAVEAMLQTGGGSIVCLSSISGLAGQAEQSTYGPAKFVASGITKHLAVEWADRGIRVNAVAPGTIQTEAVAELPDEYKAPMLEAHPIGRLGEPHEVANAILFLASDDASFITGAILPVDGGYLAR
ncbi:MAG: SDR family oxidoreductase [Actinomycetota bacterium]|jgi:NAD(P)-dependent dehydrogenase (short-subunit alcohol dehydrogenase family)|nr:SDR family oxidoreductase [Actinomycetota bacterium]